MLRFSYLTGSSSRHSPSDFPGSGGVGPPPNTTPNAPKAPSEESPSTPPINLPNTLRSINHLRAGAIQHVGTVRAGRCLGKPQLPGRCKVGCRQGQCGACARDEPAGNGKERTSAAAGRAWHRKWNSWCVAGIQPDPAGFSYSANSSSVYEYSSREANIEVVRLASRFFFRSPPNSYRTWRNGASIAFTSTSRSLTFSRKS